jgi:hypothetical protein
LQVTRSTINIHYPTAYGEVLKLVGKGDLLGNWNAAHGLDLEWTEGNVWTGCIELDPATKHEFKVRLGKCSSDPQVPCLSIDGRQILERLGTRNVMVSLG